MSRIDPTLLGLASEIVPPGGVIWDIGANLGLFSLAAAVTAGAAGYVLAIEPDTKMVSLLRRSADANDKFAKISVFPTAVADELGVARFNVARRNRSTSFLDSFGTTQTGGVRTTTLVPTVTLDWLSNHFPAPDVIKIDVEGAEATVLAAGQHVLAQRPAIICEVAGNNAKFIAEYLHEFGYTIFDGDQQPSKRKPLPTAPPNTLALGKATG